MDSSKELEEKANKEGCALCRLLLQGILGQVKRYSDFVRFARIGSYLTIDNGQGQAIANLYTIPGMCRIQLSYNLSSQLLTVN